VGIEVIMTPITLPLIDLIKRAEHEDYYDRETDFNPFKFGV
jgi:queuosine precursor transporter